VQLIDQRAIRRPNFLPSRLFPLRLYLGIARRLGVRRLRDGRRVRGRERILKGFVQLFINFFLAPLCLVSLSAVIALQIAVILAASRSVASIDWPLLLFARAPHCNRVRLRWFQVLSFPALRQLGKTTGGAPALR
jgi:hypothetical protein